MCHPLLTGLSNPYEDNLVLSVIRASRPYSLGAFLAVIREAGEQVLRGRLVRLTNRVVGPTGFLYALPDCPPGCPWARLFSVAHRREL